MEQAVIVGGGIAGLAAAHDLAKAGVPYTLIDKSPCLGGIIQTTVRDGYVIEGGPDSFISQKPEALALIRELGLEHEIIGSNDATRITYILRHGKLVRLPEGFRMIVPTRAWPMLKSPLVGWGTKFRMALELLRSPDQHPDRSVADFFIDHFGREALDYIAEPLLAGVYGGDSHELSVNSVLATFVEMEKKFGSLGRAALKSTRPHKEGEHLFLTLKGGMAGLTAKLAERVKEGQGVTVCQGSAEAISRQDAQQNARQSSGFRVRVNGSLIEASSVILACPAWSAAGLVATLDGPLSALLGSIPYTSSATVALAYDAAKFDGRRAGHGFLIPRVERARLLACTFVASKFDHRAPADRLLLRCFFGGAGDEAVLNESDETLVNLAREELRVILGLTAEPLFTSTSRLPRSMAQYTVGHAARWKEIQARTAAIPGLYLAGNGYTGVGIPDCIRMGRAAAKNAAKTAVTS